MIRFHDLCTCYQGVDEMIVIDNGLPVETIDGKVFRIEHHARFATIPTYDDISGRIFMQLLVRNTVIAEVCINEQQVVAVDHLLAESSLTIAIDQRRGAIPRIGYVQIDHEWVKNILPM